MPLSWTRFCAASVPLLCLACGGALTQGDGGADAMPDTNPPDVITTGCGQFTTTDYAVDASVCAPQLTSTTSCQGQVCSWNVEVPCFGDAGPDAGDCTSWCNAVAPPNTSPNGFCQPASDDGGAVFARCGGCGV